MSTPEIEMIWAQSTDHDPIIGVDGQLPWHLSEDLRYFKKITHGQVIIMGRKTWESLPGRPLVDRTNVVVTRSRDYVAEGAEVAHNLIDALELHAQNTSKIIIIGGHELFAQTITFARRLYVTQVMVEVDGGDHTYAYAPRVDSSWKLKESPTPWAESSHGGLFYRHLVYERSSSLVLQPE